MSGEGTGSGRLGATRSHEEGGLGETVGEGTKLESRGEGEAGESARSLFNEQILAITSQSVRELLMEYKDVLSSSGAAVTEAAERITKLAYLNMSYGFTKTSKMMAYVIIEHEKKISKLQSMCLKLEKVAEFYKAKNCELLEETRKKIEEFQSAFRNQENELMRLRTPTENYEYTVDRINKRCDILERSIEAITERPPSLNIAHLLPSHHHAYEFKRGFQINEHSTRGRSVDNPRPTTYLLHGRYSRQGNSGLGYDTGRPNSYVPSPGQAAYNFTDRDSSFRHKPAGTAAGQAPYISFANQQNNSGVKLGNLHNLSGPEWLEDYLREKKSPLANDLRQEMKPSAGEFRMPSSVLEARIQQAQRSADRELIHGLGSGAGD